MNEINQIPGKTPTAQDAPFEITIKTTDLKFLRDGDAPENVARGIGYFVIVNDGEKHSAASCGGLMLANVMYALLVMFGENELSSALLDAKKLGNGGDTDADKLAN